MTAIAARRLRGLRRSTLRAWVLGGVTVAAAIAAAAMGVHQSTTTTAADITAYEQAIASPAREGGFVIQQGMKPAVGELGQGETPPVFTQAIGWVDQLKQVQADFRKVKAPHELRASAALFDKALSQYIDAAERIGAAGTAPVGAIRNRLLDKAVAAARQADKTYDQASRLLQQARHRHGLPPSTSFPNPES